MKRIWMIVALVLVLALGATCVMAAEQGRGYVDADNDGVCDNRREECPGKGYVDADNDGVCDNRQENHPSNGQGRGHCGGRNK